MGNLKKKMSEYQNKYGDIPLNYKERLDWMCDKYRLSVEDMDFILFEKERRMNSLYYTNLKVILYHLKLIVVLQFIMLVKS